jgi:uncharacterized membrane protein YesL
MNFFGTDGPMMTALTKLGKLILANVLWLLCCIPVITVVPATTSFYYTVIKSIRRDRGYAAEEFFRSMKRTLGRGIVFSVMILLWGGALWYGRQFAIANDTDGFNLLLFAYDVLIALSACIVVCLIPAFSRFEMRMTALVKLSFVMAVRYLYFSVLLVAGAVLAGWLVIRILPMPCIVIVPGLWCYATTYIVEKMLLAYMPADDGDADAWYREPNKKGINSKQLQHRNIVRHLTGKREK